MDANSQTNQKQRKIRDKTTRAIVDVLTCDDDVGTLLLTCDYPEGGALLMCCDYCKPLTFNL